MSRKNLELIAAHTEKRDEAGFDILNYCVKLDAVMGGYSIVDPQKLMDVCGTIACIIGDCPKIKGLEPQEYEGWTRYSERITGLKANSVDWNYLFSSNWSKVDNTAKGAAKRIRYYLEHGLPESWQKQICKEMTEILG